MIHLNIGSNLNSKFGNRFENISITIKSLINSKLKINKISNFYETPSYPNKKNPKFINVGITIGYKYDENDLLKVTHSIENKMQRKKGKKNQPRTCDIDIIDFNRKIINSNNLILPHPRLHLRNFVLYPLSEIEPEWKHPVLNTKITDLIASLNSSSRIEITRINKSVIID